MLILFSNFVFFKIMPYLRIVKRLLPVFLILFWISVGKSFGRAILTAIPTNLSSWETSQPQPGTPKREYRAVWLTTIKNLDWPVSPASSLTGEEQQQHALCEMLDTLQAIGINTVLLQTRLRGDVIYPSLIEPFTKVFSGRDGKAPSYDPLLFAIRECHQRGMQCHAWIVALQVKDNKYVDPASQREVDHLCAMVREVVRNYDVDGIHLDYIRYPEKTRGNDQTRRDNVSQCMKSVYRTVKEEKPWVCVSAATLGKYRDTQRASSHGWNAYNTVFQEAQEWTREGYVDALFPMLYYRDKHYFPFVADWAENAHERAFVAGLGIYQLDRKEQDWEIEAIRSQISYIRSFEGEHAHAGMVYGNEASGYALFRAGFILKNTKGIKDEIRWFNQHPALVPAVPSTDVPYPAEPTHLTGQLQGSQVTLRWNDAVTLSSGPIRDNIYFSVDEPIDIQDSNHLVLTYQSTNAVQLPYPGYGHNAFYAVTAINRYGQESMPAYYTIHAHTPHQIGKDLVPLAPQH